MNEHKPPAHPGRAFEDIRQLSDAGNEYWLARDMQPLLDYSTWGKFKPVIEKAQTACRMSGHDPADHFSRTVKMVEIGSGAVREVEDFQLSRYACYLLVQNGDPSKPVIAYGQNYFAIQTRRQELADQGAEGRLSENELRLLIRNQLTEHNKALSSAAKGAGVETSLDYAVFQDHGYRGLYGNLGNQDIKARKGLKKSQKILDHMGSTELAANLFRATQAEDKLRREGIQGKREANLAHQEVGAKVRKTICELGGTMPEDLPTPEKSIQQIERATRKPIK